MSFACASLNVTLALVAADVFPDAFLYRRVAGFARLDSANGFQR
ncbi:hypothetical protein SEEC0006_20731 [Salmonella enterica subsp. enterica serovar Choleraesuis str. 0006]|nr:hypothetical protein SEEC0006_20731 [Salmonella enterica subsp. enterica serovar Choleraesuis str. 0006]